MAAGGSRGVVLAALLANIGVAVVKAVATVFTGSGALLAETIHSVADSGNQALLLLGAHRARRPPDARHPFGYGSERYFWAFVVALLLFSMGALFSLYEGIHKLIEPAPLHNPAWAYAVLLVSAVIEGMAFRAARRAVVRARGKRSFFRYFFESKDPAVPLVFLEDFGALLGLGIALIGVLASHLLEWTRADAIATLGVGLVLGGIAGALLVRCHRLLIGESVGVEDGRAILEAVGRVEGVHEVTDLKTLHHGPETVLVVLDVRMDGGGETVDEIERAVREVVPHARYIAVEPV